MVIKLDANSDVRSGVVAQTLQKLGFKEQITLRHGPSKLPPATYIRNTRSIPIDGIWTNFGHGTMRCGYLGFEEGLPGDHRTAWIDLPLKEVLGYNPPDLHKVHPPDLVVSDPRIVTKYNSKLAKSMKTSKTISKAQTLRQMVQDNLASPQAPPYSLEAIDSLHYQINTERKELGKKLPKAFALNTQGLIHTVLRYKNSCTRQFFGLRAVSMVRSNMVGT